MESKGQLDGRSGLCVSLLGGFDVGVGAIQVGPESWRRRKPADLRRLEGAQALHPARTPAELTTNALSHPPWSPRRANVRAAFR